MNVYFVQASGLPEPKGYAHGALARGRVLYVGGQIGCEADGRIAQGDFAYQFGRALDHVLNVVRAAGGRAQDIARMTIYVTDLDAYRAARPTLAPMWRERLGKHYPAMALVGVAGLVEPQAKVEIEAVAHINDEEQGA